MGIIERKIRFKDEVRTRILDAALDIVKKEGWPALSMRKIAEVIEYTTPVIYEYFSSKDAILLELTKLGYRKLGETLKETVAVSEQPGQRLEALWLSYWDFAFREKEYYQLMFGVEMHCANVLQELPEVQLPSTLFRETIREIYGDHMPDDKEIAIKYYTCWSIVHGLIAINLIHKGSFEVENKQILINAIKAICQSIIVI